MQQPATKMVSDILPWYMPKATNKPTYNDIDGFCYIMVQYNISLHKAF